MNNKLQTAVEIAEEIELAIIPMMVEIENEGEEDTYITCRGIYRQMEGLVEILKETSEDAATNKKTKESTSDNLNINIELEPACNAIKKLRALLNVMIDAGGNEQDLDLILIASDLTQQAGKEIARIRGVEYS